ncbi:MAG: diguanylate cyclase [Methylobacter sp.]|nr:MAG: diguanylate cyclase [Methylobacter sp.]PPD22505.1 MAG: diguanylate cyclase [Methylobacter sp.]PPD32182.1 MAG: diguanylate cyclase [Methylomonas sp.]
MTPLLVEYCQYPTVIRVLEEEWPTPPPPETIFAVFADSIENGRFCGLVSAYDILSHPNWIFADLAEHRPVFTIDQGSSVYEALAKMDTCGQEALAIIDENKQFIGVVTRICILQTLLEREQSQTKETTNLRALEQLEYKKILEWSERLSTLHEASKSLLGVLAHNCVEKDLLQTGIEALQKLLQASYGAIAFIDNENNLTHFVHTGISPEQAELIGRLPEGKGLLGVVIDKDVSLLIDDISKDPRSVGFPPNHPPMKSLLAVPISYLNNVFGRIYLSDKLNGEPFNSDDETLVKSFARSLSLALENSREMDEIRKKQEHLDYLAHFDTLTGLPNRTLFTDRVKQTIARSHRKKQQFAILFIDLDNFKLVNDNLGHSQGDVLLKEAASRIACNLRENDTIARLGGDEFTVILPDLTDSQDAGIVSEKIIRAIVEPFKIDSHEIHISASVGIAVYPKDANSLEPLLANADIAMYHAKNMGKNNYQFFARDMNAAAQMHLKLERHLRKAIEKNELLLHFQPQIDVATQKIVGMETLLRWQSKEMGLIEPNRFIPIAEETGLIISIGEWVLYKACMQAKLWHEAGLGIPVAVNLSPRQLQPQGGINQFFEIICRVLEKTGLPPHMLELEITESIMMQHVDSNLDILNRLKNMGLQFSVDDFGTGYSSLSYLKRLPIDTLKIDKSFIRDIHIDANDAAIVTAITVMAQQLGLNVVAEGVETSSQFEFLQNLYCQSVQGYFFSRPIDAESATIMLEQAAPRRSRKKKK